VRQTLISNKHMYFDEGNIFGVHDAYIKSNLSISDLTLLKRLRDRGLLVKIPSRDWAAGEMFFLK
jgi:hypothetical protein